VKGIMTCQASLTSPIRPSRNIRRASVLRVRKLVLNAIVITKANLHVTELNRYTNRPKESVAIASKG